MIIAPRNELDGFIDWKITESLIRVGECVKPLLIDFVCLDLHTSGPDKTAIHTPNEPCEPSGM